MTTSNLPGTPFVRVPPAERLNGTMAALDSIVDHLFIPLAKSTWATRRPAGHVDRDLPVTVSDVHDVAEGVRAITFRHQDGERLPPWFPGAHVDVVLPSGRMRQYSLNGRRDDQHHYRVAVRAIPLEQGGGGGSLEMHGLEIGQRVTLKGPRNAFPFIFNEAGYLFVAGGIGITPILPMLRRTARLDRVPWTLVYTGRSRASMPFIDEITEITAAHPDRVHIWPDDERGMPKAQEIVDLAPPGAMLFTCGPAPMIEALRAIIPAPRIDSLHFERFSPPPVRGGTPFLLSLARAGLEVEVGATESALSAVRRVRPEQAYSCQQGFCGTCKVRVLEGTVEHHDHVLAPYERDGHMMLCVSRATEENGRLVLDL
ncbi:PDR/VanB family oxidoreductase [Nocardioides sp.]|uniref:PDR/VanB family oxidoreductase n=1 Tax=Nocardioides sp. TaxID=35761 RepID=UPI002C238424|nr:PDR/VanB family oxidoreductase [Nocardioides sp.]HVX53192.1 PDR/VanB family oxidoreductase [Nocardioides sp.]